MNCREAHVLIIGVLQKLIPDKPGGDNDWVDCFLCSL